MSPQTEDINTVAAESSMTLSNPSVIKRVLLKNLIAIKVYWPVLLLIQLPLVLVCLFFIKSSLSPPDPLKSHKKVIEAQRRQITRLKDVERQLEDLNQRFLVLQAQHAKTVKSLITWKSTDQSVAMLQNRRLTLETLDRIGEKIRQNEPFAGLLAGIPKDCMTMTGYQTLHKYATKLPLTFRQLKASFDEIHKNYAPPEVSSKLPLWLEKIAGFFHGKIKITQVHQVTNNPLQLAHEALEVHDLKLAVTLVQNLDFVNVKQWIQLAGERILLEDEYSIFADKVQSWTQSSMQEPNL